MSLPNPLDNGIFEMKLTLGTLILGIIGIGAIASATVIGTQWIDSVNSHLYSLDKEIGYLRRDVGDISSKLDAWHFTNPEKRTDAGPIPNTP